MQIDIHKTGKGDPILFLDGTPVAKKDRYFISERDDGTHISIYDESLSDKIVTLNLNALPPSINSIQIWVPENGTDFVRDVEFTKIADHWESSVKLSFDTEKWRRTWSVTDFCETLLETATEQGFRHKTDEEFYSNGVTVFLSVHQADLISTLIEKTISEWRSLEAKVLSKLLDGGLVMTFDIPEEIRTPCEQYLLYFGQFLRDLGVKADTSITHLAGKTILTTRPVSKDDALDKIREALDAYLSLPSQHPDPNGDMPIEAYGLMANIQHLQSQLNLSKAVVQAQDATIAAQQAAIFSWKIPAKNAPLTDQRPEKILGGVVTLGSTEPKYGLSISWAELLRKLRRLFKKSETSL